MDRDETNDHPSQGSLLLFLANELPSRERREVADHLDHCWTCVAAVERLKQGIQIFIESRDALVFSDVEVPQLSVRALRERIRLAESDRGPVSKLWRAFVALLNHPLSRPLQVAAGFSLSVVALILLLSRPPSLNAGELLRRASASLRAETTVKNRWVHRTCQYQWKK
jgi:anti-sigma factor RsiW